MKKGQVTIFILLFVVLLVGFGFVFYLLNQAAGDSTTQSRQALIEEIKARTSLEQQMQECLQTGMKKSLQLIGDQGGFIFQDQEVDDTFYDVFRVGTPGGVSLSPSWIWNNPSIGGFDVPIYLRQPDYFPDHPSTSANSAIYPYFWAALEAPAYPCLTYRSTGNVLERFKTVHGSPAHDCRYIYNYTYASDAISFPLWLDQSEDVRIPEVLKDCGSDPKCERTIEAYIESYSSAYFDACFSEIVVPGYDISLVDEPNVTAFFSFTTLGVGVIPNLLVSDGNEEFSFTFPRVEADPVLFKAEAFFSELEQLLENEARYPAFNFIEEAESIPQLSSLIVDSSLIGSGLYAVDMALSGGEANIYGDPFEFRMVFTNRLPVLLPIKDHDLSSDGNTKVICAADPDNEFFSSPDVQFTHATTGHVQVTNVQTELNSENLVCKRYTFALSGCPHFGTCSGTVKVTVSDSAGSDWQTFTVTE